MSPAEYYDIKKLCQYIDTLKGDEGKATIMVASGYNVCCTDSYEDIIKQLV